ncbi:hypothetical protein DPMN_175631 [Dreissena polymorpha]|uniref:Uncharacterized protein n=1 Tax=Dreissena polymorpha TaxID=45954 RepID=A0A9D4E9G2_DREPO|nr:hypothetical protein DPMN_175631 [Dreissena polymorpha]
MVSWNFKQRSWTINNDDFIDDDVINVDDDANVIDEEEECANNKTVDRLWQRHGR